MIFLILTDGRSIAVLSGNNFLSIKDTEGVYLDTVNHCAEYGTVASVLLLVFLPNNGLHTHHSTVLSTVICYL